MTEHSSDAPPRQYRLARGPATHGHHRVTFVELFADLVFVFAVTQLSHGLIAHPSLSGLLQTAMLTMAVWWVWIYTSWATNWADPDKVPIRILIFALMAAGLVLSMSIPKAFETRALVFAGAYVLMQIGRTAALLPAMREHSHAHYVNFHRILIWFFVSAIFWLWGAMAGGKVQMALWGLAIAIEYLGPAARFYTPGLGASSTKDWDIEPAHFAERCGLFVIIALGEALLVIGATFAELPWTAATSTAFAAAFVAAAAMWWIYFNIGQERGAIVMKGSGDPGRVARGYTYVHLLIVAGIIVTAVADEFVLAHATGHADAKTQAALIGGPVLYVVGCGWFKRSTAGWFPLSHIAGTILLLAVIPLGERLEPWLLSILTSLILVIVAVWEQVSLGPDGVNKIGNPRQRAKNEDIKP